MVGNILVAERYLIARQQIGTLQQSDGIHLSAEIQIRNIVRREFERTLHTSHRFVTVEADVAVEVISRQIIEHPYGILLHRRFVAEIVLVAHIGLFAPSQDIDIIIAFGLMVFEKGGMILLHPCTQRSALHLRSGRLILLHAGCEYGGTQQCQHENTGHISKFHHFVTLNIFMYHATDEFFGTVPTRLLPYAML